MVSEHLLWESWENLQKHFSATSKASLEKVPETLQRICWLQLNPAPVAQAGHGSSALLFQKKRQRAQGRGLGQDQSVSVRSQQCWSPAPGPTALTLTFLELGNGQVGWFGLTHDGACTCLLEYRCQPKEGTLGCRVGWYDVAAGVLRITWWYHVPARMSVPSRCEPCKVLVLPWGHNRFASCWRAPSWFVSFAPIWRSYEGCAWPHAHYGWLFLRPENL